MASLERRTQVHRLDSWNHEWTKHGYTEDGIFKDELEYFKMTLDIKRKYDIRAMLHKHDMATESNVFFTLVLRWPHGCYCGNMGMTVFPDEVRDDFCIHGLWPPLSTVQMQPLRKLEDHKWKKHGYTTDGIFKDEFDYFRTVSELKRKYDIKAILQRHGIQPGSGTVSAKRIMDTVKEELRVKLAIECVGNNLVFLYQIYLHLNKEFELIDCPKKHFRNCVEKDEIVYDSIRRRRRKRILKLCFRSRKSVEEQTMNLPRKMMMRLFLALYRISLFSHLMVAMKPTQWRWIQKTTMAFLNQTILLQIYLSIQGI